MTEKDKEEVRKIIQEELDKKFPNTITMQANQIIAGPNSDLFQVSVGNCNHAWEFRQILNSPNPDPHWICIKCGFRMVQVDTPLKNT